MTKDKIKETEIDITDITNLTSQVAITVAEAGKNGIKEVERTADTSISSSGGSSPETQAANQVQKDIEKAALTGAREINYLTHNISREWGHIEREEKTWEIEP